MKSNSGLENLELGRVVGNFSVFPLGIMLICVVSAKILTKIYKSWLKECDYYNIQYYSDQICENGYSIINLLFHTNLQCIEADSPILSSVFLGRSIYSLGVSCCNWY